MVITKTEFDKAMFDFCKKLTIDALGYYERFDHIKGVVFKTDGGRKYIKVKYFTTTLNKDYETGKEELIQDEKGSIHCFGDSENGNIFKPAGWRAPHLKGDAVRGNIFDKSTFEKTDPHGGWLYHTSMRSQ